MKIDPLSPDSRNRLDPAKESSGTEKTFSDAVANNLSQTARTSNAQLLTGLARAFNKAELSDPSKVDSVIGRAVHEIMNSEFGNMCPPDRERVAAWMRSDPMMREALLKHIRSLVS